VLIPLEQSINGVPGMRYIVSDATSAGEATIRVYFEPGTDPDIAVVNVQNRVNIVLNRLPPLVAGKGFWSVRLSPACSCRSTFIAPIRMRIRSSCTTSPTSILCRGSSGSTGSAFP